MARRKKLNKRVAILLACMGALVIALVVTMVLSKGGGLYNRWFPKDPTELMKHGREHLKAGRFLEADEAFDDALKSGASSKSTKLPEFYKEVADFNLKWASDGNSLSQTQRGEKFNKSIGLARKALLVDAKYAPAQEFLTEMFWDYNASRGARQEETDWNLFIKEADALIKLKPDDAKTYFRRGSAKGALVTPEAPGDMAREARADLEKAIELDDKEPMYRMGLVSFLSRLPGNEDQIDQEFKKAIETNPEDANLLVAYSGYLRRQKRTEDAERQLDLAVEKDPVLGNLALADYYSAIGEKLKAMEALDRAMEASPADIRPYIGKSQMLSNERKYGEALAVVEKGLLAQDAVTDTQPSDQRSRRPSGRDELVYLKANILLDMIETGSDDREKLLAQVNECFPKIASGKFTGPKRSRLTGRIALAEGRMDDAVKDLEKTYKESPGFDLKIANLLINIYLRHRLPGKADEILNRLLNVPGQQRNVTALMAKARLLVGYKDFEKADRLATMVLQVDPNNVDAMNMKTIIAAVQGEEPTLPANVTPDARTIALLLDRATGMWLDGRPDDAIKYVEQLYAKVPADKNVFSRLFSMYRSAGRLDEAEKIVEDAMKVRPNDKTIVARKLLLRENDRAKQYDILLEIADEYPSPQRELEKAAVAASFGREKNADYLRFLKEASKVAPDDASVVNRMLSYAIGHADWKLADDCVARARKANLDGCNGRMYEMRLAQVQRDSDKVITLALDVLKDKPDTKGVRALLGEAYMAKRFFDQAYDAFKIVYDNDPSFVPALIGLAKVTRAQGKEGEHRGYIAAAYRLAPNGTYIRERKLEIEQETTKPEVLIVQREKVAKQRPNDVRNIVELGMLYERVKRIADAENMYVSFYQKTEKKILGARVLCNFYLRSNRMNDIAEIMEPMLRDHDDPVAVRVLYAELLTRAAPNEAKVYLENAITADPKDPRAYLGLARFWAAQAKWSDAANAMSNYVRLRPEDVGGARELIRYFIEAKEHESAGKRLAELLRSDPTNAASLSLSGILAWRRAHIEEALRLFSQAIQNDPTYAEPLLYRARVYLAQGENNRAKADLQEAKRLTSRVDVAMQLGMVFEVLQDVESAELVYREIHSDRPDYPPAIDRLLAIYKRREKWLEFEQLLAEAKEMMPANPALYAVEADAWQVRDNIPKKLKALAEALRLKPDSAQYLQSYLSNLLKAKQYGKVIEVSDPYMKMSPFPGWVAAMRAGALVRQQKTAEADQLFRASLETIPPHYALLLAQQMNLAYEVDGSIAKLRQWIEGGLDSWRAHLLLGMLYAESKRSDEAIKELIQARDVAQEPQAKYLANRHLGSVYYQMNRFRDCEKSYLAALANQKNDVQVANNLAYLYTNDLNEPQKARPHAAIAAQMAPNDASVLDTYGWTLAKLNSLAEAEKVLLQAVQVERPLAVSRYHLGWVYEQLGRLADASKQYREGFEMVRGNPDDPLYEELKQASERISQKMQRESGK